MTQGTSCLSIQVGIWGAGGAFSKGEGALLGKGGREKYARLYSSQLGLGGAKTPHPTICFSSHLVDQIDVLPFWDLC